MASKFGYTDTLQGIAADSQQKTASKNIDALDIYYPVHFSLQLSIKNTMRMVNEQKEEA